MNWLENKMNTVIKKRKKAIMNGYLSFPLDSYECEKYFNVKNETFHRPMCHVEKVSGDKAFVSAVFTGSGILSHPVRNGWIPISKIHPRYPWLAYIWYWIIYKLTGKNKENKPKEDITLLAPVPKNIFWKIWVYFMGFFWLFSTSITKKSWSEYYHGMIKHNHSFDYENPIIDEGFVHFACKHHGCNLITVTNENGNAVFVKDGEIRELNLSNYHE